MQKLKELWQNKKVRLGTYIFGIFILLIMILRSCTGGIKIDVAEAKIANLFTTVSVSGMVKSNSVDLGSAQMAGRVDWIGVKEGDKVRQGQLLMTFDGYDQVKKEYDRLRSLHAKGFVSDLELEKARTAVKNASVVAPIAGVVTDRAVDVGESVSPGYSVMTVVDTDNPWSEIQIDEVDIAKVKIGQKVKLTTDAFQDKEVYGEIIWLNKEAELKKVGGRVRPDEEDLVFRAKVKFQDDEKMLKPGMSVYAEVIVGEKKNVLTVSRNAVTLRSGKKVVFVLKGRRVKEIEVKIGAKDIEKVEVNSGLAKGEKVAVSNLDDLKNNSKVKVNNKK